MRDLSKKYKINSISIHICKNNNTMINYSIEKPHPLCGHFVKINNESDYNEMKAIAESCGFNVTDSYNPSDSVGYTLNNNMTVQWCNIPIMSGQEVTIPELKQLAELSEIELPCDMEVWDVRDDIFMLTDHVVDFYKGMAVCKNNEKGTLHLWNHFSPIKQIETEIKQIETVIEALQAKLNTLKEMK